MPPKTPSKIRLQLACLVFAAVLPVWLAAGFLVFHAYSVKRDQANKSMQEAAHSLATVVDRELSSVQAALMALATAPAFGSGDLGSVHRQALQLLKSYPGANIIVADATGQQVVNSARPFGVPLPRRNNPETVRRIFANGKPVISDLFHGAVSKKPLISIDIPVMCDGKVSYDLAMTFPSDRMVSVLLQQRFPPDWYGVILDSKPIIIARSRYTEKFVGKPANPALRPAMSHTPEGTVEYTNVEGKRALVTFCRSAQSPWSVVVGMPKASLMAGIYQWVGWVVAVSTALSLFGIAVALGIARRIVRAQEELGQSAMRYRLLFSTWAEDRLQATLKSLEEEMAERQKSEERLRLVVDGARDYAIIMLDVDGRVSSWNEGAKRLKGWDAEEALGRHMSLFYPAEAVASGHPEAELARAAEKGRWAEEGWRVRKDGSRFMADVIITAIRDASGKLRGFSKVTRDITERKQAEEQLQSTLLELERSNQELEQFAYIASHDLQEPLRMVSSYTQLLARRYEDQLDDKAKKFIDYAVDGAVRMQRLINDLLAYSRVSTRGKALETIDTHAALGETLQNLTAAIEESRAIVVNDDLPAVRADATQLSQLFQNLIGNAIKFRGADAPCIHVSSCDLGREWRFSVSDNGIGIEAQYAEKVFVIFQRLHTRQEYPGTGIGLAICKRIVERHGGRIWFESEPGSGSSFNFTLPK
jgi:PAS domain S-box-containing protein